MTKDPYGQYFQPEQAGWPPPPPPGRPRRSHTGRNILLGAVGGGLLVVAVCLAVLSQSRPMSRVPVAHINGARATTDAPAPPAAAPAAAPAQTPQTPTTVQQIAQGAVDAVDGNGMTVEKADANICTGENMTTGDPIPHQPCPPEKFPTGDDTVQALLTFNDGVTAQCQVTYHAADGSTTFNCPND